MAKREYKPLTKLSDLPEENRLVSGHRLCAGCGPAIVGRLATIAVPDVPIVINATGCLEVGTTLYPYTSWAVPWAHVTFENAAAVASGVVEALDKLSKEGRAKDAPVIAFGGDGGTFDIGLQALSGALERGHRFLYICLHPDEELILGDGTIVPIGEMVESHMRAANVDGRDGFLSIPLNQEVLSWDGRSFRPFRAVRAQRKESPPELVQITTRSGERLRLTPEHRVLVDGPNGFCWKQAAHIQVGDELYSARNISIHESPSIHLIDYMSDERKVIPPSKIRRRLNRLLAVRHGSIKRGCENLGLNYWLFKERGRPIPIGTLRHLTKELGLDWERLKKEFDTFKGGKAMKVRGVQLNQDLLYILGLIAADGHISRNRFMITFVNKEKALVETFMKIHQNLFSGRKVTVQKDSNGTYHLTVSNPVLYELSRSLKIAQDPKEIIRMPEPLISSFVAGVFDGDGYCGLLTHDYAEEARIIISSTKEMFRRRIRLLLKRLGIASFLSGKDVVISSRDDLQRFIERVKSKHPKKLRGLKTIEHHFIGTKRRGKYFSISPRVCGRTLKDSCRAHDIPVRELDANIFALSAGTRRATKERIQRYASELALRISGNPAVGLGGNSTEVALDSGGQQLLTVLEPLLVDDYYLDPVVEVERISSEAKYVYDVTVEESHVFVPNGGFVISNCYDNEAYANTGVQRSGATPFGAATTTSPAGRVIPGKQEWKKDLVAIVAAHHIPYAATSSIAQYRDFINKVRKALSQDGPSFIHVFAPCTFGWRFDTSQTIQMAKLIVDTRIFPVYEIENGTLKMNFKVPKPKPVEEYLKTQRRFAHLLKPENKHLVDLIQKNTDENWERLLRIEAAGKVF